MPKAIITCCLNCERRHPVCHATCEIYKKEHDEWERQKENIRKIKERESDNFDRFKYWR